MNKENVDKIKAANIRLTEVKTENQNNRKSVAN